MKGKGINKTAMVIAKILEVIHWIGVVFMIIMLICSVAFKSQIKTAVKNIPGLETEASVSGFEIAISDVEGEINTTALALLSVDGIIVMALMAMIFRNVYLIVKKSDNDTPFQKDIVRMMREIGIFSIAVSVVGLIMSIISCAVIGANSIEHSVNLNYIAIGIMMLCLSQYFAYGTELQKDNDGLL